MRRKTRTLVDYKLKSLSKEKSIRFCYSHYIRNFLVSKIYIKDSRGFVIEIPPSHPPSEEYKDTLRILTSLDNRKDMIKHVGTGTVEVDEHISIKIEESGDDINLDYIYKDLESINSGIYIPEFDISICSSLERLSHPSEDRFYDIVIGKDDEIESILNNVSEGFDLMVDNKEKGNSYYVNILGKVSKIHTCKNPRVEDGFYIKQLGNGTCIRRLNMEEAVKEMDLYSSYNEALNKGDHKTNNERLILELKQEIERERLEAERQKVQLNSEYELLKNRFQKLEHEYKTASLLRKEEHEKAMNELKFKFSLKEKELTEEVTRLRNDIEKERLLREEEVSRRKQEYEQLQLTTKLEIEKLKGENERYKAELERLAQEEKRIRENMRESFEREKMRYEETLAEQSMELERLKHRNAMAKINYEERSMARKDTSDFLKHLPLIISGVLGLGYLLKNK